MTAFPTGWRLLTIGAALLGLLVASATNAHVLNDPALAQAAARYRALLANKAPAGDLVATRQRAAEAVKHKHWARAIAAYEMIIATGDDGARRWLQLARAWRQASDQHNNLQRALQAAYNAWQSAAEDPGLRATALFRLGDLYQRNGQSQQALAAWKAGLALRDDAAIARRYQALHASLQFRVQGLAIENDSATPRVCLNFSRPLARGPQIRFADYLMISPAIQTTVEAHDNRLCIAGVAFSHRYHITVRPGVPAANGQRTEDSARFTAAIGDRPARVGFRGSTYVLPRSGRHSVPLTTVNVERVRLALLHINDRNLSSAINAGNLLGSLDGYARRQIARHSGERLWHGTMTIADRPNQDVTTAVPLEPMLANTAPGIYVVTAADAGQPKQRWHNLATQWLVISDIGITSLRGSDGLHVYLRSLASAKPLANVTVKLYARNNSELGEARSDVNGQVRFAAGLLAGNGGREPAALMAYGARGDFDFLDLTQPAFDLSDRGVAGRNAPGPVDAYLYSDRGVYRPGETVQLIALLRDSRGHELPGSLPLTLRLIRPDQVEAERLVLHDMGQGAYHSGLKLPANARSGNWQARVYLDPKAAPVGHLGFQVQDFQPQRLRLKLSPSATRLERGKPVAISIKGEYLYGAPAAQLNSSAELVLQPDPKPYPSHPGYHFGRAGDTFSAQRFPLSSAPTDGAGAGQVTVALTQRPATSLPLQALIRFTLFDPGGQAVNQTLTLPYRYRPYAIGIKPLFGKQVPQGRDFGFDLIALDNAGRPHTANGLHYVLYREDYQFYWYYQDSRWNYRRIVRDSQPLASGTVDLSTAGPYTLRHNGLDWGDYRLEVYDPARDIASSVRFQVGWFAGSSRSGTPDQLQLNLDHSSYRAGAMARVHIQAPFAGTALVTVASDKLWLTRNVELPAGGTTIELPVDSAWSPGVYVLASAFRPAADHGRGPGRAVGVAWLGLDPAPRTLAVHVNAPSVLRPRQRVQVPITVDGLRANDHAYVTLAAVDEGILQLTDFASPDPRRYFLGKRRLGMDLLDLYGRLITPRGQPGRLRSGGGANNRNLHPGALQNSRTVALFSGPVRLDAQGKAIIALQLPDFNGELRLMAVAWDADRFGATDQALKVRDPLVSQIYLPRFLAPGDRAHAVLALHNLDAPAGHYTVDLNASGALALDSTAARRLSITAGGAGAAQRVSFTVRGQRIGSGRIVLRISGPDGLRLRRQWNRSVRPAQAFRSNQYSRQLAPGATLRIDNARLADYLPGTGRLSASFSSHPTLAVPTLLRDLQRYPYGCLEQLSSRALALLYYGDLARSWRAADSAKGVTPRLSAQSMIQRILAMQRYEGGFGLWTADDPAQFWLSAYAMDLLTRARKAGYLVPSEPYRRGLQWLRERLGEADYRPPALAARAYALYVLSQADAATAGELRYLFDNYLTKLPTRLARAQLGAALARFGDQRRARKALQLALAKAPANRVPGDYGSALRDQAGLIAMLAESGLFHDRLAALAEQLADRAAARRYTSTQEKAWLLLAAHALDRGHAPLSLTLDGQPAGSGDPLYLQPSAAQLSKGLHVTNHGTGPVWVRLATSGVPTSSQPATAEGFAISRQYYTRSGQEVDPATVDRNTLLVALVEGKSTDALHHQVLAVDLLPAGFELENADLAHNASIAELAWLPPLTIPAHQELRADRYVATFELDPQQRDFTLAYLVRVVTPGSYTLPAPYVEDMYQPWLFGRGKMGRVTVR